MSIAERPPIKPAERVPAWIKIFVFIHVIAITSWSMPRSDESRPLKLDTRNVLTLAGSAGRDLSDGTLYFNDHYLLPSPLRFYSLFTGFWQYWDMFSPNPSDTDFYCTALITYKNGKTFEYQYPRMYKMSIAKKYVSERYRKFYERVNGDAYSYDWPTFAQRIALINFKDPNNPPVQVKLTRHWFTIPPPEEAGYPNLVDAWHQKNPMKGLDPATAAELHKEAHANALWPSTDEHYFHYDFFTYPVDEVKLIEDKNSGPLG